MIIAVTTEKLFAGYCCQMVWVPAIPENRQADVDQDDAYCEECEIDRPYCLCSQEQWV